MSESLKNIGKLKEAHPGFATQANELVEASYRMSIAAKRAMLLMLGQIHPKQKGIDERIRLNADDYAKRTGTSHKRAYDDLKKGVDELITTTITMKGAEGKPTKIRSTVASGMEYHDGEGWLDVKFSEWIEPLIIGLTENSYYTTIAINEAVRFRRFYTIRLFELLMQFKKKGIRRITVQDLRRVFQIPDDQYPKFTEFRRKILVPSINEIEAKTNWIVMWQPIKKGRTITSIQIAFSRDDQMSFEL